MTGQAASTTALIRDARSAVRQAHALLLEPTPRNVSIACTALSNAVRNIQELQPHAEHGVGEFARSLRESLREIGGLLDAAAVYHARLLESMIAHAEGANAVPKDSSQMGTGVQLHA